MQLPRLAASGPRRPTSEAHSAAPLASATCKSGNVRRHKLSVRRARACGVHWDAWAAIHARHVWQPVCPGACARAGRPSARRPSRAAPGAPGRRRARPPRRTRAAGRRSRCGPADAGRSCVATPAPRQRCTVPNLPSVQTATMLSGYHRHEPGGRNCHYDFRAASNLGWHRLSNQLRAACFYSGEPDGAAVMGVRQRDVEPCCVESVRCRCACTAGGLRAPPTRAQQRPASQPGTPRSLARAAADAQRAPRHIRSRSDSGALPDAPTDGPPAPDAADAQRPGAPAARATSSAEVRAPGGAHLTASAPPLTNAPRTAVTPAHPGVPKFCAALCAAREAQQRRSDAQQPRPAAVRADRAGPAHGRGA